MELIEYIGVVWPELMLVKADDLMFGGLNLVSSDTRELSPAAEKILDHHQLIYAGEADGKVMWMTKEDIELLRGRIAAYLSGSTTKPVGVAISLIR